MKRNDISDEAVAGMVAHLDSTWTVASVEPLADGANSTFVVEVVGGDGPRRVVLKTATGEYRDVVARSRAEPRLLRVVRRETSVPVPRVLGFRAAHETYPAPFYVMEHVAGETFEDQVPPSDVRERILWEAGRNLADLHALGPLDSVGTVGAQDGEVTVLDTGKSPEYDKFHDWLLDRCETALEDIERNGGWFPELTDDPDRFDDLVPDLRRYIRREVSNLPDPEPPTFCHKDYRTGNLVVDPETGATEAVLDWGLVMAAPPAFNLALTEQKLLSPDLNHDSYAATGYAGELRDILWDAYADSRPGWTFDEATRERIRAYRLSYRLAAMACLPLWYRNDDRPKSRDVRAMEHRAFVEQYL